MSRAYDAITDRIIAKLEEGVVPWCKPWYGKAGLVRHGLAWHGGVWPGEVRFGKARQVS